MKLYWAPQTRAFTALWMLEESGLPYERVLMDWRGGALSTDSYRAINPMMKVPALEDGPESDGIRETARESSLLSTESVPLQVILLLLQ